MSYADRLELHELAARYGDIIDARDWPGLAQVFTSTAVFDVTSIGASPLDGLASIQAYMATEARHPEAHVIANVYVEELGAEEARMRSRLVAVQVDGSVAVGEYRDRVVRTEAGWRIEQRVFTYRRRRKP